MILPHLFSPSLRHFSSLWLYYTHAGLFWHCYCGCTKPTRHTRNLWAGVKSCVLHTRKNKNMWDITFYDRIDHTKHHKKKSTQQIETIGWSQEKLIYAPSSTKIPKCFLRGRTIAHRQQLKSAFRQRTCKNAFFSLVRLKNECQPNSNMFLQQILGLLAKEIIIVIMPLFFWGFWIFQSNGFIFFFFACRTKFTWQLMAIRNKRLTRISLKRLFLVSEHNRLQPQPLPYNIKGTTKNP